MVRHSEFRVLAPHTKPAAHERGAKPQVLSLAVAHVSLGEGQIIGLRLGDSGVYIQEQCRGHRRIRGADCHQTRRS